MKLIIEIVTYADILFTRIADRWQAGQFFTNFLKLVAAYVVGVLTDIRVYIISIVVLVVMDMVSGIGSSLKRGEKFNSRKLRTGLIERFILYGSLTVVALCIDSIVRGAFDYGEYYVTVFCCTIVGFYEAGSTIENLIECYPKFTFLQKIAKLLNLIEKKYQDNTVNKVSEILNSKIDEDEKG